jgi:hypothetical protein
MQNLTEKMLATFPYLCHPVASFLLATLPNFCHPVPVASFLFATPGSGSGGLCTFWCLPCALKYLNVRGWYLHLNVALAIISCTSLLDADGSARDDTGLCCASLFSSS